jgi:hypothetical protein
MPRRARLLPAAAAALANVDADIVIAGINAEGDGSDDLLIDPLTSIAGPALFAHHALGCVFLLRMWIANRFGVDAQALIDAIKNGASCMAVPIAAAKLPNEVVARLRLQLARKPAQTQAQPLIRERSQRIQQH